MKRIVAGVLLSVFALETTALAVDSKGASYFGGTVATFKESKRPVEGRLDTKNDDALVFAAEDKPFAGQTVSIPYSSIIDLEYGQKAGRRVGAAAATTILLGPIGLLTLLSKKRNHFLTVGFKDAEGKDQVAVLELGKDIVRVTLPIVETRSGKKVEYQDDEARKSARSQSLLGSQIRQEQLWRLKDVKLLVVLARPQGSVFEMCFCPGR